MRLILLFALLSLSVGSVYSQEATEPDTSWDNWLIMGNKVVFGGVEDWKHSHEIQWRADNNLTSLNTLMYEAVLTYSPTDKWELVPDIRYSIKPNRREIRPGFGIVRKDYIGDVSPTKVVQFAQQVKWQMDIKTEGASTQAVRYVPNISIIYNQKWVVGGLAALLYQYGSEFDNRLTFVRFGPSFAYVFDKVHTLSFVPAFGLENFGGDLGWAGSFTPIVQLIIRVNKDYKYLPARYINF